METKTNEIMSMKEMQYIVHWGSDGPSFVVTIGEKEVGVMRNDI
jgi:hypothetical protein